MQTSILRPHAFNEACACTSCAQVRRRRKNEQIVAIALQTPGATRSRGQMQVRQALYRKERRGYAYRPVVAGDRCTTATGRTYTVEHHAGGDRLSRLSASCRAYHACTHFGRADMEAMPGARSEHRLRSRHERDIGPDQCGGAPFGVGDEHRSACNIAHVYARERDRRAASRRRGIELRAM